jgi:hypothetical protein
MQPLGASFDRRGGGQTRLDTLPAGLPCAAATLVFCFFQFAKVNFLSLCLYALSTLVFAMFFWRVVGGVVKRYVQAAH